VSTADPRMQRISLSAKLVGGPVAADVLGRRSWIRRSEDRCDRGFFRNPRCGIWRRWSGGEVHHLLDRKVKYASPSF